MVKGRHKPPSRIRYEQSHPVSSCRLDKKTHDLLKQRLEYDGISFAQFVKSQLGILELKMPDIKKIEKEAHQKGYAEAVNEYRIQLKCHRCGKPMTVIPNSKPHKAIRDHLEGFWNHINCQERNRY